AKNDGRSCMVLRGRKLPWLPERLTGISVPHRQALEKLYFLETAYWLKDAGTIATYRVRFTDGTHVDVPVVAHRDVGDWWNPKNLPNAFVAWWARRSDFGVYIREWKNPHPEKDIRAIDVVSANSPASLAVLGITGVKYVKPV
ncbi:MAG: hypothetical protein GY851_03805, partial [bacterium]|nr:hypothetical protein [bacterium]